MIEIANAKTVKLEAGRTYIYVGRGRAPAGMEHAHLGNPFKVGPDFAQGEAAAAYLPHLRSAYLQRGPERTTPRRERPSSVHLVGALLWKNWPDVTTRVSNLYWFAGVCPSLTRPYCVPHGKANRDWVVAMPSTSKRQSSESPASSPEIIVVNAPPRFTSSGHSSPRQEKHLA